MRYLFLSLFILWPTFPSADEHSAIIKRVVEEHILVGFDTLSNATSALNEAAQSDCNSKSIPLQAAFHNGFDAWLGVSHLRFGPTETNDRAFALAYWPDTKGFTPKTLLKLLASEDMSIVDQNNFATFSIAGRGFYALEFLLFDEKISQAGNDDYRCMLIQTVASDIHTNSAAILSDWQNGFANQIQNHSDESPYQSQAEAVQELYKALGTGLEFTSETRLGRPLGSFERPRPMRAEARRSGRSLRNVILSLQALKHLSELLTKDHPSLRKGFSDLFDYSNDLAEKIDRPDFSGVGNVQGRLRVEILQQSINRIREEPVRELGSVLGIAAGFNALDGD